MSLMFQSIEQMDGMMREKIMEEDSGQIGKKMLMPLVGRQGCYLQNKLKPDVISKS